MRYIRPGCLLIVLVGISAGEAQDPLLPESWLWANWNELPSWVQENWLKVLGMTFSVHSAESVLRGQIPALRVIIWFPDMTPAPFIYPGVLMVSQAGQPEFPERVLYAYEIGYLAFGSWMPRRAWQR